MQKSAVHITTVSRYLRDVAAKSPIMANKEISVIYNGIDVDIFCPGSRADARARLNLPQDRFVVLLAGQTIEGINQEIAQQGALALNRLNDPRVLPLLVGTSSQRVADTLHGASVTLPFQRSPLEMALCYRAADVTLVASEVESFGRIAAESQTCGTPVITSDAGGLPEVVRHGLGGLVVPMREVEGFVRALEAMLNDVDGCERMGRDGAKWARENFADAVITRQYIELYRTLIARHSSRGA